MAMANEDQKLGFRFTRKNVQQVLRLTLLPIRLRLRRAALRNMLVGGGAVPDPDRLHDHVSEDRVLGVEAGIERHRITSQQRGGPRERGSAPVAESLDRQQRISERAKRS